MPGSVHSGVTLTEGSAASSICILWALLSGSGTAGDLGSSGAGPWWSLRGLDTPGTEHCSWLPKCCRQSHSHAPASPSPSLGLPLCSIQTFLKSSRFLRLSSRATSSRKPCMEKASALCMSWTLPISVPTGSAVLITLSVGSGGHCALCDYIRVVRGPRLWDEAALDLVSSSKALRGDAWLCHGAPPALAGEQVGSSPARRALTHLHACGPFPPQPLLLSFRVLAPGFGDCKCMAWVYALGHAPQLDVWGLW